MSSTGLDREYFVNGSFVCDWAPSQIIDSSYNCSYFWADCYCPQLKADPDIAGIGVIIAFVISAAIAIISTVFCLLLSCACQTEDYPTFNWIDGYPRRFIRRQISEQHRPELEKVAVCLKDVVFSLSDTQLATALAMLIVGLKQLADGTISVYHFTIVTDLVWFSSNAHLMTLILIRSFNISVKKEARINEEAKNEERKKENQSKGKIKTNFMTHLPQIIRISLICTIAALMFYASWVTGYAYWYDIPRCPALCTLDGPRGGLPRKWMAVNFFYILWSYPIAVFLLIPWLRIWWIDNMRARVIDQDGVPQFEPTSSILYRGLRYLFLLFWYFISSEMIGVLEICVWFSLGIWWIRMDRIAGHEAMDPLQRIAEDNWGFGQLLPNLLLILPPIQFFVSYAGYKSTTTEQESTGQESTEQESTKQK